MQQAGGSEANRRGGCPVALLALVLFALPSWNAVAEPAPPVPARSLYVEGTRGARLAVDVYLPQQAARRPAILVSTRYGRRVERDIHDVAYFIGQGYAFVIVDSCGSGASFGARRIELGAEEVADIGQVSRWIASQPWSDGRVALMGTSYSADAADLGTGAGARPIRAAVIRFTESDPYLHNFFPGGVANTMLRDLWGLAVAGADRSVGCVAEASACRDVPQLAPVDDDPDYTQLRRALREHLANARIDVDMLAITFSDDTLPGRPETLSSRGTLAQMAQVARHRVPVFYSGSWLDAGTALSALRRYQQGERIPARVLIGATDHGMRRGADPFRGAGQSVVPAPARLRELEHDFLQHALPGGSGIARRIDYAVMGSEVWRSTASWPPAGVRETRWPLGADQRLGGEPVAGTVTWRVDMATSTGKANRWRANMGVLPDFSGWAADTSRLLDFVSAPIATEQELVGEPRLELELRSSHEDGAVFAYLAVERGGRLHYVTEGMLRLIHRRPAPPATAAAHRFARADLLPMVPGETARVVIELFPTAVRLAPGDRLHLLLAGADAGTFQRYPLHGDPLWEIAAGGSELLLPLRDWQAGSDTDAITP